MKKIIFLLSLCGLVVLNAQAQTPIDEKKFDAKLLKELILEKVDSVRLANEKKPLKPDPIMELAAADHANYLAKKETLTHFQDGNKKKHNPQDRVVYFGGKGYLTGENAAEHPIKVLLHQPKGVTISRVETYEQSALLFVQQWVNSPMHNKNLMREDYLRTGIGVEFSQKNGRIYAVQVFSPEPMPQ